MEPGGSVTRATWEWEKDDLRVTLYAQELGPGALGNDPEGMLLALLYFQRGALTKERAQDRQRAKEAANEQERLRRLLEGIK